MIDAEHYQRVLGDELRKLRRGRGWTRKELNAHLQSEISLQTLATYELGTRQCSVVRLVELCVAMDELPQDLLAKVHSRVFTEEPGRVRVDLRRVVAEAGPELTPLRRWAEGRLRQIGASVPASRVSGAGGGSGGSSRSSASGSGASGSGGAGGSSRSGASGAGVSGSGTSGSGAGVSRSGSGFSGSGGPVPGAGTGPGSGTARPESPGSQPSSSGSPASGEVSFDLAALERMAELCGLPTAELVSYLRKLAPA